MTIKIFFRVECDGDPIRLRDQCSNSSFDFNSLEYCLEWMQKNGWQLRSGKYYCPECLQRLKELGP